MIVLDATIVNVALPKIQTDLGFSQSSLAWVVNAYLISFGGLLLFAGRPVTCSAAATSFLSGLVLFTAASLACGVSDSQSVLVVSRFIQGIGGALTSAVILGMIVTMFPEPGEQAKAIGVYSFVSSAGGSIGCSRVARSPRSSTGTGSSSSTCRSRSSPASSRCGCWRVTVASALQRRRPARCGPDRRRLMMGVYAIVEASNYGWGSAHTLGFGAGAVALRSAS